MTDSQTRTRHQAVYRQQFSVKPVLLATASSLALIWIGAWLIHWDEAAVMAAYGVVVVLGILGIALRVFFGKREGETDAAAHPGATAAIERTDRRWTHRSSGIGAGQPVPMTSRHWSLDVFAAIDAKRFAAVCETWFSWAGFDTRSETHRTDEGVDIWLHAARMPGPVAIVRCKHWRDKPVGLQDMKEFLGLVANFQSAHGTYTTTSTYTPEALQFARENGIDAVDGRGLLRRIQTRTRQRQQALLAVAYNGQT